VIIDKGGFVYLNPNIFPQAAAADVDPAQAKVLAAAQKPYNQSILAEKSGPPAWKQLPTWYAISENDHLIPPAAQHMFAKQMNATTNSLASSHASYISHPNEIAAFILKAANGIR
jgi:pimeloyl-ACP methyl ester carboxylesterase